MSVLRTILVVVGVAGLASNGSAQTVNSTISMGVSDTIGDSSTIPTFYTDGEILRQRFQVIMDNSGNGVSNAGWYSYEWFVKEDGEDEESDVYAGFFTIVDANDVTVINGLTQVTAGPDDLYWYVDVRVGHGALPGTNEQEWDSVSFHQD